MPDDSFPHPDDLKALKARRWSEISVGTMRHPLIDDAKKMFAAGLPDRHRSSTHAAGQPIFEVRSREGAAWRGAVALDEHGDPWLIFAAKHDRFHDLAARTLRRSQLSAWMPSPAEYKLRDREEAELAHRDWKRAAIAIALGALATAANSPKGQAVAKIPGVDQSDRPLEIHISLEHDAPLDAPEHSSSIARVFLLIADHEHESPRNELLSCLLPVLQPDTAKIDSTFRRDGQLEVWLELTHAKVVQLAALDHAAIEGEYLEPTCSPNTHLHYVARNTLTEALVSGRATRAICGVWFVPTKDKSAELPICPSCDEQRPWADKVAAVIRQAHLTPP